MEKPLIKGKVVRSDADLSEEAGIKTDAGRASLHAKRQMAASICVSITTSVVCIAVPMIAALLISTALHHGWSVFASSSFSALVAIVASELGDKTFFIAAILGMTQPRLSVWSGAVAALSIMTIGASALGSTAPQLLPVKVTHLIAMALFTYFGLRMLWNSRNANTTVGEGLKEAEDKHGVSGGGTAGGDSSDSTADVWRGASQVLIQAFALTFTSEWGDRSQIATLAIAADKDVYGVCFGATLGHCICTGLAVAGGRMIAAKLSEKVVLIAGGSIFLAFALAMAFGGLSTHLEWGDALF